MAIISNRPWTTKQIGEETIILDREGKSIGFFHDWQDAEHVTNLHKEVETLNITVEKLETDIEDMEKVLAEEMNSK